MYQVTVLYYTDTQPNGITISDLTGDTREDCIQKIIDQIERLEIALKERTLNCKIIKETCLLQATP